MSCGAALAQTPAESASPTASSTVAPSLSPGFTRIEAVRSDWQAQQPPANGWVPVTLPDDWATRWPGFDGVVWYRLTWQQAGTERPVAVTFDYLNMAGAIYANGSLLARDARLVEPLTRAWNTPRYEVIAAPLLRDGTNTLLIRVSGLSAYQPGLSEVALGDPLAMQARFDGAVWLRHDLQLFSLAVTTTLGCFFFCLWLMRPREVVYGWFTMISVTWWWVAFNQVATSTWPFATTDAWEIANTVALVIYSGSFVMFLARFCERRLPRVEATVWALVGIGCAMLILAPVRYVESLRAVMVIGQSICFLLACIAFIVFAWRRGRTDQRFLAACVTTFIAAAVHDLLAFLGISQTNLYLTAPTAQFLMIGMALVLAWHFVANLRRIERFNDELNQRVDDARVELAGTLQRQHELEMINARLGERLNLAHDLHDGLGGALVSNITALEHAPKLVSPDRFLGILKEMRDDLRIIIDTAAGQQVGEHSLADQMGPLRHRLTQLFEQQRIACDWRLEGLDACHLNASRSLELMRILQEALANVLKHSRASRVDIHLRHDTNALALTVRDNGVGCDTAALDARQGAGMRSMRARASRLGGTFHFASNAGATVLTVYVPQLSGSAA